MTKQESVNLKIASGCDFCTSLLPTIIIETRGGAERSICRACILEALKAIEEPSEYPAVIEDRDTVLKILEDGHFQ